MMSACLTVGAFQLTFTEIVNTLISEGVIVPLPRELSLDQTLGSQGLHNLDDFKVRDFKFSVLGSIVVLGGTKGTIYTFC